MEEIVFAEIERLIDSLDCCTCEKCKADIATLTLNSISPKYVNSEKGELFSKLSQITYEARVEVIRNIIISAEVVKKNPNHTEEIIK